MKKVILLLVLALVLCPLSAATQNLSDLNRRVNLPFVEGLGQLSDDFGIPAMATLKEALESNYNLEWIEKYFDESVKGPLSLIYTPLFSELLPYFKTLYAVPVYNGSFCTVRVLIKDVILDFVLDTGSLKIISVVRS